MDKIVQGSQLSSSSGGSRAGGRKLDWRKRMSDTVAYGLMVYTVLQIFVTMHAIEGARQTDGASLLPVMALVVLVVAIIPMYRRFERRWEHLSPEQAADPMLKPAFRRDQQMVWLLSAGLPLLLAALFRGIIVLMR